MRVWERYRTWPTVSVGLCWPSNLWMAHYNSYILSHWNDCDGSSHPVRRITQLNAAIILVFSYRWWRVVYHDPSSNSAFVWFTARAMNPHYSSVLVWRFRIVFGQVESSGSRDWPSWVQISWAFGDRVAQRRLALCFNQAIEQVSLKVGPEEVFLTYQLQLFQ